MLLQAEIGLMALVVVLYLYDGARLLHCNEAMLRPRGRRGWAVCFGSQRFQIRGRELFVPNPLLMHKPLFLLSWALEGIDTKPAKPAQAAPGRRDSPWEARRNAFRGAAPMIWGLALALFVLLPLGLFTRLGEPLLLLTLGLIYLNVLLLVLWLWLSRKRLGMSGRQCASLSFEYLTCAPFALNVVRNLSLREAIGEDLVDAARKLQSAPEWAATRQQVLARLVEEIESEEDGSERQRRMQAHRERLAGEGA